MIRRLALALLALAVAGAAQAQPYRPGLAPGFRPGFQFISGGCRYQPPGATAYYGFVENCYGGPTINVSRSTPAYIDDSAGTWRLVPPDTLRRSDKGALIEGAQTNAIRNNAMQGVVAGTPGTLPTLWSLSTDTSGLTRQIVGSGVVNGIDTLDLRISGTPTGGTFLSIVFDTATGAAQGQLWTLSTFAAVTAGSTTNTTVRLIINEHAAGGGFLAQGAVTLSPTGTLSRYTLNRTLTNASTALLNPQLVLLVTTGQPIDITLRIGWPQIERWDTALTTVGGASSPIRTTGSVTTRAADVVTGTFASAVGSPTMAGVVSPLVPVSAGSIALLGSTSDGFLLRRGDGDLTLMQALSRSGGATTGTASTATGALGSGRTAFAAAFDPGGNALSVGGSAPTIGGAGALPAAQTAFQVGAGAVPFFGYVERLAVWPTRLTNGQLQTYSTLAAWGG